MMALSALIGESAGITAIREQLSRLLQRPLEGARRPPPILLLGETGTGKGLLAEAIHRAGPRAEAPFVDLNCAAIPETLLEAELFGHERGAFTDARQAKPGLFEAAHRGTLFLDEIGLMPLALQAKLLKAIEERVVRRVGGTRRLPVDVWVLAATSEDLQARARAGAFRPDLYHRLSVVTLRLPPLRERGGDVLRLAAHFLERACREYGVPPKELDEGARAALAAYPWPGNVRELANVLERVALLSDERVVTAATLDLPAGSPALAPAGAGRPLRGARTAPADGPDDRAALEEALRAEGGNLSRAAARLGLARNTLRYRLEKLGLRAAEGGRRAPEPPAHPARAPADGAPQPDDAGAPELRRVTVFRASLGRGGAASATEAGRVTDRVVEKMRSFGGEVIDGDAEGATAAFGLRPLDDAPRRAAHAALVIRQTLARERGGAGALGLRMAIHTESLPVAPGGQALAGDGETLRATLGRLLEDAAPGEIAVSAAATAFLRGRFDLSGPAADRPSRLLGHADPKRERTRLVGRDRELRLLLDLFDQAAAGQGRAVTIVGEPGIGKSRLLRELRRALHERAGWIEGHVVSGGRAMPLAPLVDLLHRLFRIDEGDPDAAVLEKLDRGVLALGESLRPLLPFLRYLLSVDPGDGAVAGMDPDVRRQAIFDAVRRLVFAAAERLPQVVVVEDVHWIDHATEQWLRLVADGMTARQVLLVLTTRPEYAPPFRERTFHIQLPLGALSGADSVRMACALLAAPDLPEPVQQLIVGKAEGNPFFVEEVVRSLLEVQAVRREGDRLVLARGVDEIALPDTVQDVILSRIERLSPELRRLLEVAAVIGKDVPFDVLAAVEDRGEAALRDGLRELQGAEFLYETSLYPEWAHTFRHALTHEVAYGRLAAERRQALHARIVAAIERVHAGRLADQVERLAHHAVRGEQWEKALAYARQAGDKAMARSANREAVAYFQEALAALARLPATPARVRDAIDLRFALRSALIPLGDVARILAVLREAESLASAAGDDRRLGWCSAYMTISWLLAGEHERALAAGERALRLGHETDDVGLTIVSRAYLGHVLRERGEHPRALALFDAVIARLPGERALERFGQAVQPVVYALSLGALSRAALGGVADAVRMADEGFRISEAADRPFGLALSSLARAQVLTVRWEAEEARALAERVLAMIEARSLPLWRPWALAVLGWAHGQAGRHREGVRALEDAIALAETIPFLFGQSLWMIWLGLTHVLGGDLDAAEREAGRALALTRRRGERGYEAWAHYLRGEVAGRRPLPDLAAAEAAYRAALACATALGMRPLAAHCHAALGRVLTEAGRSAEADAHQEAAAAAYRDLGLGPRPESATRAET
jgi:DNA-binding NtrC family response regulator/tetratricopeptide (TPR) repeat protein